MAQMRYGGFSFPYHPRRLEVGYARTVKVLDLPFAPAEAQEICARPRVVKGEGEFFGPGRERRFALLAGQFGRGGAARLVCPLCPPMDAYFTALRLVGEAGAPVLRYAFEFVEAARGAGAAGGSTVSRGESLWELAARTGVAAHTLLALNPGLRADGAAPRGEEVRLA